MIKDMASTAKYTQLVTVNGGDSVTVAHGLGTADVVVSVFGEDTPYAHKNLKGLFTVAVDGPNSVTLTPTALNYDPEARELRDESSALERLPFPIRVWVIVAG